MLQIFTIVSLLFAPCFNWKEISRDESSRVEQVMRLANFNRPIGQTRKSLTMLNVQIIMVAINAVVSLGNCRKTVSHKTQKGDAKGPYDRMLDNGRNGRPLWNVTEPMKACTVDTWCKYNADTSKQSKPIAWSALTGNCRLLTIVDAIATLKNEGVVLTADQLLIPVMDVSGDIGSCLDIKAYQIGDNEKDSARIKVTALEKLQTVIDAKQYGLDPKQESQLKHRLKFNRQDQQAFCGMFRAMEYMPELRARLLACPTDSKVLAKLEYDPTGPFPPQRWPRAKVVSLFAAAKKTPALLKTIADDIEQLLADVLTDGVSASKRLGYNAWLSASEETANDSVFRYITACIDANDMESIVRTLKPLLYESVDEAVRLYRFGIGVELTMDKRTVESIPNAALSKEDIADAIACRPAKQLAKKAPAKKAPAKKQTA